VRIFGLQDSIEKIIKSLPILTIQMFFLQNACDRTKNTIIAFLTQLISTKVYYYWYMWFWNRSLLFEKKSKLTHLGPDVLKKKVYSVVAAFQ
jgi:hypothetical protein